METKRSPSGSADSGVLLSSRRVIRTGEDEDFLEGGSYFQKFPHEIERLVRAVALVAFLADGRENVLGRRASGLFCCWFSGVLRILSRLNRKVELAFVGGAEFGPSRRKLSSGIVALFLRWHGKKLHIFTPKIDIKNPKKPPFFAFSPLSPRHPGNKKPTGIQWVVWLLVLL